MAFKSLQLFLLLASVAAQVILAHDLRSHRSFRLLFPQHLQGSRKGHNVEGIHDVKIYLQRYGYLSNAIEHDDAFDDLLESAIKVYQKNFKLNVSGILEAETLTLMSRPRCAVPDFFNNGSSSSSSSSSGHLHMGSYFAFYPGKPTWPRSKYHLTYAFINDYPTNFIAPVTSAMEKWGSNSVFTFTPASHVQSADIVLSFERGYHGDPYPFDGKGGTLAHAFGPRDGRIHFDADETWTVGAVPGAFDLEMVALHELGHVLGLGHSFIEEAVMWAYMDPGVHKGLHIDDITGIHVLYGNR